MLFYHQFEITPMAGSDPDIRESSLTNDAERNRLLAEMAEQSTDMISRHTPDDWRFIYASPAVEHLLGYSVDEIVGMSAYELYHPDDVEDFKRRAPSVSYERGTYTHTYRFRCKDGHYTWLESTSRSIRDPESGELKEILVVSRDASRRINAEMANRRLAKVLESSSDLVAFADLEHKISNLNEAARHRLGLDNSDWIVTLREIFSQESYLCIVNDALHVASDQGQWRGESEMIDQEGVMIPVILEIQAHRTFDGRIDYFSLVARDMSAQKEMEIERQQYQDEVSRASRLITMGEMASGLAHELNQPLTAIVNYVRGIERRVSRQSEIPSDVLEKPLHKISTTALRAGEIIRRMMDFSRKGQPQRKPVAARKLVDDVISFCSDTASRHEIKLINNIRDEAIQVEADRVQLEQVMLNLLLNAIEAYPVDRLAEDACVWVSLASQEDGQVIIQVRDSGIGLPATEYDQLFEQFFTTKEQGLGMGLAICRSIIESHGGRIWADSASDGGTVFSFTLNRA